MPSSFIRRRVRGLLRSKFSPSSSQEGSPDEEDLPTPSNENQSFLSRCYLAGIDGRRIDFPEVYCGKTGLDIPCIQLQNFDQDVLSTYTGPEGGLTEVGQVRKQPMVQMANLDDEMSLSMDGTDSEEEAEDEVLEEEEDLDQPISTPLKRRHKDKSRSEALLGSCSSLLGPNGHEAILHREAEKYDWKKRDDERAFGISVSLYEKNPLTGVSAGEPIADVWGVVARNNNGVLALADGVNWGEGARLAARCAIRGALDHLNDQINKRSMSTSTEVFHELLAAFHSAHSLILQEGGMLTTLCVAVVVPAKHGNSWVLCVCNVGDSLCFVYNRNYGVREVTLGSHDIDQMRDMRDAGGALGPVDGRNPQLHNFTCSMTFVEEGDMVFITSDGVSDNFDPVVGKFCVIKKTESENKENAHLPSRETRSIAISTKDSPSKEYSRNRTCAASLPCVDAAGRHELMLVRMRDIIANGFDAPEPNKLSSPRNEPLFSRVSSSLLCNRLIHFATQLSTVKRKTLENPELYKKEKMTKSEQRAIRRAVREKIMDMPGKLDHASVVCYRVGLWDQEYPNTPNSPVKTDDLPRSLNGFPIEHNETKEGVMESSRIEKSSCAKNDRLSTSLSIQLFENSSDAPSSKTKKRSDLLCDMVEDVSVSSERPISPYEQIPITSPREIQVPNRRKKHARGSAARHTLGVDVQWLKKLVTKKDCTPPIAEEELSKAETETTSSEKISLRSRLRSLLGSSRNLSGSGSLRPVRPQALPIRTSVVQ